MRLGPGRPSAPRHGPRAPGGPRRTGGWTGSGRTGGPGGPGTAGPRRARASGEAASQRIVSTPSAGVRSWPPTRSREARQRGGETGSVRPARVHRVRDDAGPGKPPRPFADERDLGALGPGVGAGTAVGALLVRQVVERQGLRVHAARRHGHDPPVGALGQARRRAGRRARTGRAPSSRTCARTPPAVTRALGEHRARVVHDDVEARLPVARISSAAARTDASDDMSATTDVIASLPLSATSSARVRARRAGSRPTSTRRAPMRAKDRPPRARGRTWDR